MERIDISTQVLCVWFISGDFCCLKYRELAMWYVRMMCLLQIDKIRMNPVIPLGDLSKIGSLTGHISPELGGLNYCPVSQFSRFMFGLLSYRSGHRVHEIPALDRPTRPHGGQHSYEISNEKQPRNRWRDNWKHVKVTD